MAFVGEHNQMKVVWFFQEDAKNIWQSVEVVGWSKDIEKSNEIYSQ